MMKSIKNEYKYLLIYNSHYKYSLRQPVSRKSIFKFVYLIFRVNNFTNKITKQEPDLDILRQTSDNYKNAK